MPEPPEFESLAVLLRRIGALLFGGPPVASFSVQEIYDRLGEDSPSIDLALKKMERSELILLDLRGPRISLLGTGRATFAENAIAEVVLGRDYIAKRYRSAIVHIIVKGQGGDESGGTGFFTAYPSNSIATAAHVVNGRRIIRVIGSENNEIPYIPSEVNMGKADLDIALMKCPTPPDCEPIRIEWKPRRASPLADLIVFGYPKIAGIHPGLHHSTAQLHQIGTKYPSEPGRDSLVISATQPGCSGGPVMDARGFAIGIVEQENILQLEAGANSYFCATPAHYLSELM
jgi:hypothetical protein